MKIVHFLPGALLLTIFLVATPVSLVRASTAETRPVASFTVSPANPNALDAVYFDGTATSDPYARLVTFR